MNCSPINNNFQQTYTYKSGQSDASFIGQCNFSILCFYLARGSVFSMNYAFSYNILCFHSLVIKKNMYVSSSSAIISKFTKIVSATNRKQYGLYKHPLKTKILIILKLLALCHWRWSLLFWATYMKLQKKLLVWPHRIWWTNFVGFVV